MSLKGQVALITGAGRGIGKAIALKLAQQGADIAITDRALQNAEQVKEEITALGVRCTFWESDVTDLENTQGVIKELLQEMAKVDILVNNAGITQDNLFMRMKPEQWARVIDVNLNGVFHVTRELVRSMTRQRYGRIINISSVVGFTGNPGQTNYSATKAALVGFSKSLARELGSRNITVNAVAPGFIETDMTRKLNEAQQSSILTQVPLGRMGSVDDIANAVSFLASEQASYITGTVLHVNGGMY